MNNFKNIKISDLPLHISDGNYSSKYPRADEMVSHGVPFIRANNLKNGTVIWEDMKYISSEKHEELQKGHLEEGDVLITVRGDIGKLSIVPRDFIDANINAQIALLRVYDRSKLDNKFLFYSLNTPNVIKQFNEKQTGTALKQLPIKSLREVSVLIPAIKEQQKIAEILSSVDAAIEKTEQVIAKTEEVKKRLMQQLLTKGIGHTEFKQTEIGEIPVEWEIKNLVEVAVLTMGQSPSSEDCNEDGQGLVFFQGCSEFGDKYPIPKKYCTNPRKRASKGDILISVRAPVGDLNIAHIECAIGRGLAAIDPINIDRDYLFYYFKLYKDQWQRIQQGSTFSAINKNGLESLLVPCPPKDEQMLIASKLLTLDKKLEIETEQLDSLQILKKGLMQQLLTGQVRVKVD